MIRYFQLKFSESKLVKSGWCSHYYHYYFMNVCVYVEFNTNNRKFAKNEMCAWYRRKLLWMLASLCQQNSCESCKSNGVNMLTQNAILCEHKKWTFNTKPDISISSFEKVCRRTKKPWKWNFFLGLFDHEKKFINWLRQQSNYWNKSVN